MTEAKDMIHDIFDKSGLRTEYGGVIEKDDLASFFLRIDNRSAGSL